ncbi:MAG TPA: hypothetical protein VN950_11485 [Terriglobales bacterium]|nr:hypothetical protein [Terriglobales bacterium]
MKNPFFFRLPVLWAVEDSSAVSLTHHKHKKPSTTKGVNTYYPWLLLPSFLTVFPLVWAVDRENWIVAQSSLITLLLLLALTVWCWWQQNHKDIELSVEAATYSRALEKLLWCVAIGMLALFSVATQSRHWQYHIVGRAIGYGILVAGFSFISGVLLGYLFGLHPTDDSATANGHSSSPPPSTNLAEIADWLTKVILGAGLVQLTSMPRPIWLFANKMALGAVQGDKVGQPWEAPNPAIALAIMGFFSACGLLYGYLWTRYEEAVTAYGAADASAAALVSLWLNGRTTPDDQTRSNMMDAVKNASSTARIRIFLQAEQYRKSSTEEVNERSLPVFQALVDADSEGVFHRNRSQCALALMGKKKDDNPTDDWSQALSLLNDAIRIRDRSGEPAWREYEFARAVCQIKLDPSFNKQGASDPSVAQFIQSDLDQATSVPLKTKILIDKDHVVKDWTGLNPRKKP